MSTSSLNTCKMILDDRQIMQKLRRMSYQLAEDLYDDKEIVLVGIRENGYLLAKKIAELISEIGDLKVSLHSLKINKKTPHNTEVVFDEDLERLNGKTIVIIDDVTNTGKIMTYSIKPFLNILPKKLRTLVLVDRKHKAFPVSVDYTGVSLATTMKEHIRVEFNKGKATAYLC